MRMAGEEVGAARGTEGEVSYSVDGVEGQVMVYWNNPYLGWNGYFTESVPGGTVEQNGDGLGEHAEITFDVLYD